MEHTPSSKPLSWQEIVRACSQQASAQIDDKTAGQLVRIFTSFRTNRAHGATEPTDNTEQEK